MCSDNIRIIFLVSVQFIIILTTSDDSMDGYYQYFSCYYNKYNDVEDSVSQNQEREKFVSNVVSLSIQNKYEMQTNIWDISVFLQWACSLPCLRGLDVRPWSTLAEDRVKACDLLYSRPSLYVRPSFW